MISQLHTFKTVSPFIGYSIFKLSLLDNGLILSFSSHKNKWIGQFVAIFILLYYYYNGHYIWSCSIYWCLSEQGCTIKWSSIWMADVYRKGGRGNNLWLCTCISSFVSCIHSFFKILIPYWNFDPFIKSFKHFYLLRFVFLLHNFDIQKTIYKYFFC